MLCRFSDQAETDLEEIGDFIAKDNRIRAATFVAELREHCESLLAAPMRKIVGEVGGLEVRQAVHGRYNIYFVWFEDDSTILITRILHSARSIKHG